MDKNGRKAILIGAGVVIVALIILLVVNATGKKEEVKPNVQNTQTEQNEEKYTTNLANGTKLNNGEEFNKNKKYKDIEISNIQFTYENGRSVLLADLKNTGSTTQENEIVKITILDENNKEIDVISPIFPKIAPGQTEQLNIIISGADSVNAKNFKIEQK